ncbi:hypothetical protein KC317_g9796 [Hortaea werneckii]|nr:hypothetical protein KC317_g9796 [Hortaea werneckii]
MRGTVVGVTRTTKTTLLDTVFDSTFMSGSTLDGRCSPFRGSTVPGEAVLNVTNKQVVAMSEAAKARIPQQQYTPLIPGQHVSTSHTGSYGMPGYGGPQLTQAQAPPPLRGGYRGALGGQANGAPRAGFAPRARGGGLGSTPTNGFQQTMPIHTRGGMNGGAGNFAPRGRGGGPNGFANGVPRGGRGGGGAGNRQGYTLIDNSDPTEGIVMNNPKFRPQNYSNVPPPADLNARGRGRGGGRGRGRGGRGRGSGAGQ